MKSMNNFPNITLIYFFVFVLFTFSQLTIAQDEPVRQCGTDIDDTNIQKLLELNRDLIQYSNYDASRIYLGTTFFVPVQIHIIRTSSGTGGISSADALAAFDRLNEYYIDASIHFYQCSAINYIDNSIYYDYTKSQKTALDSAYAVSNVVNIYVANTVSNSSGYICGHAEFPGGLDFVMQSTSCMKNGSTLAHEMGHYFSLFHTHETAFGNEAVNGFDCVFQGDEICDTPADPQLTSSNFSNAGCNYYGTVGDENGAQYDPMVNNLMSYASKECRTVFTLGQTVRILSALQLSRSYLSCTTPPLKAFFYTNPDSSCTVNKQYEFYNASLGNPTAYSWDFGDGLGSSTAESPVYNYTSKGIYSVSLTVDNGSTTDTYSRKVVVGAIVPPYNIDFENGSGALDEFEISQSMKNQVSVDGLTVSGGSYSLLFDGTESNTSSPYFVTPTDSTSFMTLWNPYFKSKITLCVDASNFSSLELSFDKRQFYTYNDNYTNFRITVNDNIIDSVFHVVSSGTDDTAFVFVSLNLDAYAGQVFTLGFEGSHKYDNNISGNNTGSATYIDNINIDGTPIVIGNKKIELEKDLAHLFPNPTSNMLSVEGVPINKNQIQIFNTLGQEVTSLASIVQRTNSHLVIDLNQLISGTYIIKGSCFSRKIIKI